MKTELLRPRWEKLILDCGADVKVAHSYYLNLTEAYEQPNRSYHNLTHLAHFFFELDSIPLWDAAVEWATWYHDIVYNAGKPDNESQSATQARDALTKLGLDDDLGLRVAQLVMATKTHVADPGDTSLQLFLDADMAILGATAEEYAAYAKAVREEHSHIPDFLFKRGRANFLSNMLKRDFIFVTEYFRERYEKQARENLNQELKVGLPDKLH